MQAAVSRRPWLLVGLFALACTPRVLLVALRSDELQFWEYETLAANIAAGKGYVISRFGHEVLAFGDGNLYSFLAGALYALAGHAPVLLAVVQAVLASLAVPVLFVIAERPFGTSRAALGAALAAFHPGLLAYSLKLHPLGLDVLLLTLVVYWALRRRWSGRDAAMAGLTLGLSAMSRPTFFVAGLAALAVRGRTRPVDRRALVAAVAVALLVLMPWVARNWMVLGQPLLASTSFEDVWKGNNLRASGSGFVGPSTTVFDVAPDTLRQRIWEADELQANSIFAEETLDFIRQRPDLFAALVVRKFLYFWWLPQQAGVTYPPAWLTGYEVYAGLLYAFAAIGAIGIIRAGKPEERALLSTIATVGLALALLHALAYVDGRHRWGIEPLVLLITARGVFVAAAWLGGQGRLHSRVLRRFSER
jgi:hypothetical protein